MLHEESQVGTALCFSSHARSFVTFQELGQRSYTRLFTQSNDVTGFFISGEEKGDLDLGQYKALEA